MKSDFYEPTYVLYKMVDGKKKYLDFTNGFEDMQLCDGKGKATKITFSYISYNKEKFQDYLTELS
jgi:hypothetical protein